MVGGWYRPKFPERAEVYMLWPDGRRANIGTIEITVDKHGMMEAHIRHIWLRIGWEFVRIGLRLMFYRGKDESERP